MNKMNKIIADFKVEINDHRLFLISENLYDHSVGYMVIQFFYTMQYSWLHVSII